MFGAISSFASGVVNTAKKVVSTAVKVTTTVVKTVVNTVKNVVSAVVSTVSNAFNKVKDTATKIYSTVKKGASAVVSYAKQTVQSAKEKAIAVAKKQYEQARQELMKFSCGTATFLKNTADTVGSTMATVDWSAVGHTALDVAGMLPVVGTAADVLNGVWYAAEGNYVDAAMSFVSAIPVVGDAIGAGKIAAKAGTTLLTSAATKGIVEGVSAFGGAVLSKSGRLTDNVIDEVDQGTAFIERMAQYAGESLNNAKAKVDVPEKTVSKANDPYHANDLRSQREQHGYLIFRENEEGVELAKFGISSTPLNKNGTSKRANSQVNKFNKEDNDYSYFAVVLPETMKGRELATTWEKEMAKIIDKKNLKLSHHKIP